MKRLNLENHKYGRLTVIKLSSKRTKHNINWICLCECGKETVVNTSNLRTGHTISCGCAKIDLTEEVSFINEKYSAARYRATSKHKSPFLLTKEEYSKIGQGDCYWCGQSPTWQSLLRGSRAKRRVSHKWNGIDRLDSNKSYEYANCVPCCANCNWLKQDFTVEEFLGRVNKIAALHAKRGVVE